MSDGDGTFERPIDLAEALRLLDADPDAVVLAGSTDLGVETNLRGARLRHVIAVDRLRELRMVSITASTVEIGAALTLSEVEEALGGRVPLLDQVWPQFASRLIRNGATIGGNLGTASPIGDLAPALLALDATLVLASSAGERAIPLADYFTGYRETLRRPGELIRAVRLPARQPGLVAFHKIAKRRYDDISSVAVAFAIHIADGEVVSGPDRARRSRRDTDPRPRHRRGAARSPVDRGDGRGRGGRAVGRGHPDRRPSRQRGVPLGDAGQRAAKAVRGLDQR